MVARHLNTAGVSVQVGGGLAVAVMLTAGDISFMLNRLCCVFNLCCIHIVPLRLLAVPAHVSCLQLCR